MEERTSSDARALILMYHRVATLAPDEWGLCISPETFRGHMIEIRRTSVPMSLAALGRGLESGLVPPGAVAITFDDGCIDNLTAASDILLELELPATFFIPTERLDEKHEFWWDTLERIFGTTQPLPASLDLTAETGEVYDLRGGHDRSAVHRTIAEHVRRLERRDRDRIMQQITDWSGMDFTPRETHRPMVAPEIQALAVRPGHDIGAHSVHHIGLPGLTPDLKRREMYESKATLERLLGQPVTSFAYPYGLVDNSTVHLAGEFFNVAVTTRAACVTDTDEGRALPRFDGNRLNRAELVRMLESIT